MNNSRAREIMKSMGVIEVNFEGRPVWIERVNSDTARVQYLDTKERGELSLNDLLE